MNNSWECLWFNIGNARDNGPNLQNVEISKELILPHYINECIIVEFFGNC